MFSTNCTQRDIDKARKLGADDYITKPFEPEQLIDNLKKFFKK